MYMMAHTKKAKDRSRVAEIFKRFGRLYEKTIPNIKKKIKSH